MTDVMVSRDSPEYREIQEPMEKTGRMGATALLDPWDHRVRPDLRARTVRMARTDL